jgi:XFP C-terminal domain
MEEGYSSIDQRISFNGPPWRSRFTAMAFLRWRGGATRIADPGDSNRLRVRCEDRRLRVVASHPGGPATVPRSGSDTPPERPARTNHKNLHVRGYKEEGTTTTPFDMVVRNDLDRFHLVNDVIDRVPGPGSHAAYTKQALRDKLIEHRQYITLHGEDMPEVRDWTWPY